MTIKGLSTYLSGKDIPKVGRKNSNDESIPLYLNQLKGKKIAIETACFIYKQNWAAVKHVIDNYPFSLIRENDREYWSRPSNDEVYIIFKAYFRSFIKRLCNTGIIPVFVIEGKSPEMKGITIQKRLGDKKEQSNKIDILKYSKDLYEFKKNLPYAYPPSYKHSEIVIDILKEMNLPTVQAKHEGEGVCAYLVNEETSSLHCDAALTDDYDIFMYGCRVVIRNLRSISHDRDNFEIEGYAFQDILSTLELSQSHGEDQFRLLCILSGSDYSDNVYGFGPGKICTLIKKYNITSYDDICKINERFLSIPYRDIIDTIEKNKEYTVITLGCLSS